MIRLQDMPPFHSLEPNFHPHAHLCRFTKTACSSYSHCRARFRLRTLSNVEKAVNRHDSAAGFAAHSSLEIHLFSQLDTNPCPALRVYPTCFLQNRRPFTSSPFARPLGIPFSTIRRL